MFAYVGTSIPVMTRDMPNPYSLAEMAKRLRSLRKALDNTQVTMGTLAGVSDKAWQNYEAGIRRIEIDAVTRLRAATGATSEYIYYGNMVGLPVELAEKIQIQAKIDQTGRKMKRR